MNTDMHINKRQLSHADQLLIEKTITKTPERYPDNFDEEKRTQVEYELNTIINMGFPDYFLIVQDFLDIGRKIGHMPDDRINYLREHCKEMSIQEMVTYIEADQSFPGMTIGPGRGSAAGSKVAYILGITNIDPVENGLLFERFLNPERVSMPDIDSDLSKSEYEYGVRDIVIEYVTKKYGQNAICGITTPSTQACRAAVKNVARIIGTKKVAEKYPDQKTKESKEQGELIRKQYLRYADEINREIPKEPNTKFSGPWDNGGTVMDHLQEIFKERPELLEIIEMSAQIEGLNTNYGMHACGKIIFPGDIRGSAALMYDVENSIWKIQMDAEQAESAGYLKMDFLGLKNLNIITKAVRLIYRNSGIYIDCDHIPEDPDVYREVFANAKTMSVFQFESAGMRNMLKQFAPEHFSDLVLLVACYRPGPMKYLPGIIRSKHHREAPEDLNGVLRNIPQIASIIEPTYQAIVYQEQVQQIFRTLAGYSLGQADIIRRAMGHKKMDVLEAEKVAFLHGDPKRNIVGCEANGVNVDYAAKLFDEMLDFAKYAFNKSHAAAYARLAYITGWLKYHYPTEYYTAVLSFSDISKFPALIQEAKTFHVKVIGPDIERSRASFDGKDGEIYFGFSGIKGIGDTMKGRQFVCSTIPEFMATTDLPESVISKLVEVGAFDRKAPRQALLSVLGDYFDEMKVIRDKKKEMNRVNGMIEEVEQGIPLDRQKWKITTKNLPTQAKLYEKRKKIQDKIDAANTAIREIIIPSETVFDNIEKNLEKEKEFLGMYASGHPLDPFGKPEDQGCASISEADMDTKKIFGIVQDFRTVFTKKDNLPMAIFKLEDQSGTINVCCFNKAYNASEAWKLNNGDVAILIGYTKEDSRDESGESLQFFVGKSKGCIRQIMAKKDVCLVEMDGIEAWKDLRSKLLPYLTDGTGYPVKVRNTVTGGIENTDYRASEAIWHDPELSCIPY
ncbi:MAG: DNA polymerase III subunit alpha [Clostridiales bacterium]|nr:DNA polymerase III subunit alpha [Clostridiales bacterium]